MGAARKGNFEMPIYQCTSLGMSHPENTRYTGYVINLSRRWLVEKGFGWLKQTGPIRQVKLRGLHKVSWLFVFSCAAQNLYRRPRLFAQSTA
jgi:hypothetical protein